MHVSDFEDAVGLESSTFGNLALGGAPASLVAIGIFGGPAMALVEELGARIEDGSSTATSQLFTRGD